LFLERKELLEGPLSSEVIVVMKDAKILMLILKAWFCRINVGKPILLMACLFLLSGNLSAQGSDYWVFFKDKAGVDFDPATWFSEKALERRQMQGIEITETDKPVVREYVKAVEDIADEMLGCSRWFNAAYIKANHTQVETIRELPFVKAVEPAVVWEQSPYASSEMLDVDNEDLRRKQLDMFFPEILHEKGLNGNGVRIAVLDGGFPGVDTHQAFSHLRDNNQIIKAHDFVKDKETVFHGNKHGTMVLSCIAGKTDNGRMGLAQAAEFLLARTEKNFEPFKEEIYWMEAMEWADKEGADLINSSLGYTYHRYFKQAMDGKTSLVSKAANMAASKGILVVNAAGNSGTDSWHVIGTPADADSILTVGGVDPDDHLHINFSSFGPTADGRLKPNVCASGEALVAFKNGYLTASGTSFASPLTCGFAACVKQAYPEYSIMELIDVIQQSASLYPYYDYAHGYGIPSAWKLFSNNNPIDPTFELRETDSTYSVHIPGKIFNGTGMHNSTHLFYHLADKKGKLESYKVIKVYNNNPLEIKHHQLEGKLLRMHYLGYTLEKQF
jgi:serine protease AprX